jgi:hypothetical protein
VHLVLVGMCRAAAHDHPVVLPWVARGRAAIGRPPLLHVRAVRADRVGEYAWSGVGFVDDREDAHGVEG